MLSIDDEDRFIAAHAKENDGWPFGEDCDRTDPLVQQRIAVTSSHPGWAYLVAFDHASEERPTDREVAMLRSYLEEYKAYWYNPGYLARLARRPLDVDGGANGVIFHKWATDDWGYRRRSYRYGNTFTVVWPLQRDANPDHNWLGPFSLLALMDRIHTIVDKPRDHWVEWKAAHPEVFGQEG